MMPKKLSIKKVFGGRKRQSGVVTGTSESASAFAQKSCAPSSEAAAASSSERKASASIQNQVKTIESEPNDVSKVNVKVRGGTNHSVAAEMMTMVDTPLVKPEMTTHDVTSEVDEGRKQAPTRIGSIYDENKSTAAVPQSQKSGSLLTSSVTSILFGDAEGLDGPDVDKAYENVPLLDITHLPRGGVSIETQAVGHVQVSLSKHAFDVLDAIVCEFE